MPIDNACIHAPRAFFHPNSPRCRFLEIACKAPYVDLVRAFVEHCPAEVLVGYRDRSGNTYMHMGAGIDDRQTALTVMGLLPAELHQVRNDRNRRPTEVYEEHDRVVRRV